MSDTLHHSGDLVTIQNPLTLAELSKGNSIEVEVIAFHPLYMVEGQLNAAVLVKAGDHYGQGLCVEHGHDRPVLHEKRSLQAVPNTAHFTLAKI